MLTAPQIWERWRVKVPDYRYILAVYRHPGSSNQEIAECTNRSPQIVGRFTRRLVKQGVLLDANQDSLDPLRALFVADTALVGALQPFAYMFDRDSS